MVRTIVTSAAAVVALVLVASQPAWADYGAGQRAWDAGAILEFLNGAIVGFDGGAVDQAALSISLVEIALLPPCRSSYSATTCFVMPAQSSGRTSSFVASSKSTAPSTGCATVDVFFNANVVSTLH